MKKNSPRFFNFFRIAVLWAGIFFTSDLLAQVVDLNVDKDGWVIPVEKKEVYQNVTLKDNSSVLEVNGTLIVNGNLVMDGNNSQFIMGPDALVVVYGNFIAHNQVNISVSSFLIVYGDFSQKTGSGQAEIDATSGNIYIFGDVDENWNNFDTCLDYEGNVSELGTEACDYGTGDNYEDNYEEFPEDFKDAVNCYDLTAISNKEVCEGAPVTFSVAEITNAAVEYEWQEKTASTDWVPVKNNPDTYTYTIPSTSVEDSGKLFRVIVRPSDPTNSTCKISISRKVLLTVITLPVPVLSSNSPVCEGSEIQLYSSISGGTYQWTGPNGFTSSVQNPVIPNASQAKAGEYSLIVTNAYGCSSNSHRTTVEVNNLPVPVLSSNSPVCEGGDIKLTSSNISGGTYQWTGPNGFTSSVQDPVIPNVSQAKAGDYSLIVTNANGCSSIISNVTISIINKSEWTGAEDTNWNNINNWSCNSLPTLNTNVTIPASLSKYPVVSTGK